MRKFKFKEEVAEEGCIVGTKIYPTAFKMDLISHDILTSIFSKSFWIFFIYHKNGKILIISVIFAKRFVYTRTSIVSFSLWQEAGWTTLGTALGRSSRGKQNDTPWLKG